LSRQKVRGLKPYISVLIVIMTLFTVVFFKMEVRRLGYIALKESRSYKSIRDQKLLQEISYAQVIRPERVRQFAMSQLTLIDARSGQIIQMTGSNIAIRQ